MTEDDWRLSQLIRLPLAGRREPRIGQSRIGRKNGVDNCSFGVRFKPPMNPDLMPRVPILVEKGNFAG